MVRSLLARYRGVEVDTAGDGFFATFDGPARAIRCARAIAVHIGARICAMAGQSEVLVSQTVRDLVAGSGLAFEDRGEHTLKGIPDRWRLYRVMDPPVDGAEGAAEGDRT